MLFLDTSALLKRYVEEVGSDVVDLRMQADDRWAASAMARTEAEISLCRFGLGRRDNAARLQRLRDDWELFLVVPVDSRCLGRAAELGCLHDIRTLDAVHLAAAERLPQPLTLLTFDRRQADAARSMDLAVEGT